MSDANKNKDYTHRRRVWVGAREISFCPPSSLADSKKNSRESGERESGEREREREIF